MPFPVLSVSVLVVMTAYLTKANCERKGLVLTHSSKVQCIMTRKIQHMKQLTMIYIHTEEEERDAGVSYSALDFSTHDAAEHIYDEYSHLLN